MQPTVLQQKAAVLTLSSMGVPEHQATTNILLNDTTAITATVIRSIQVLADATFTTLTGNLTTNDDSTISIGGDIGTLDAGTIIYGKFTAVTLASGTVILYK